jgi:hypothetical protein
MGESSWNVAIKRDAYPDFPDYFQLERTAEAQESPPMRDVADEINGEMEILAIDEVPKDPQHKTAYCKGRDRYAKVLKAIANEVSSSHPRATNLLFKAIGVAYGQFAEYKDANIRTQYATIIEADPADPKSTIELKIEGLPPQPTSEQQTLQLELMRAKNVIEIVLERRHSKSSAKKVEKLRSMYFHELKDIADMGLSSSAMTSFAQLRLNTFKDAVVAREAEIVKTHHMAKLGAWALGFVVFFLVIAGVIANISPRYVADHLPASFAAMTNSAVDRKLAVYFLLLSASAAVGTWLSQRFENIGVAV